MTSRIDIIGQNGNDGGHYVLADLLQLSELDLKYDKLIWEALDDYVAGKWGAESIVEWEWGERGFLVDYTLAADCDCCSYNYGTGFVAIEELVGSIENAITNS